MLPKYAVVATDDNPLYTECWPIVLKGWQNLGIIPIVVKVGEVKLAGEGFEVINIPKIEGIPNGFIAQVVRFIVPAYFPEAVSITSDIDMLPLSKTYFTKNLQSYSEDSIVILTSDAYGVDDKFPMCYIAAKGRHFQSLIGLEDISEHSVIEFIKKLFALNIGWTTDEVFLGSCVKQSKGRFEIHFLDRCKEFPFKKTRIDRSDWKVNTFKLLCNSYIDSHLVRPLSEYREEMKLLSKYVHSEFKPLLFLKKIISQKD